MHRFFIPSLPPDRFLSDRWEPLFHQINNVFRAKKWQQVIFFENGGADWIYEIIQVTHQSIHFQKKERAEPVTVDPYRPYLVLFQAYPHKISTLELIVQKTVEMWVRELVLFPAEYSQVRLLPGSKIQRLSAIAREAMEQSWNNQLLGIHEKADMQACFMDYPRIPHIIAHPDWVPSASLDREKWAGLWVWPEGWWSPKEQDFFLKNNLPFWSFNNNILRLETASILGIGILAYLGQSK